MRLRPQLGCGARVVYQIRTVTLRTRLGRPELRLARRDEGCRACQDRRGLRVLATLRLGTAAPPDDWPQPCPRCGDIPEQIIEIIEEIVETHERAAAST